MQFKYIHILNLQFPMKFIIPIYIFITVVYKMSIISNISYQRIGTPPPDIQIILDFIFD